MGGGRARLRVVIAEYEHWAVVEESIWAGNSHLTSTAMPPNATVVSVNLCPVYFSCYTSLFHLLLHLAKIKLKIRGVEVLLPMWSADMRSCSCHWLSPILRIFPPRCSTTTHYCDFSSPVRSLSLLQGSYLSYLPTPMSTTSIDPDELKPPLEEYTDMSLHFLYE